MGKKNIALHDWKTEKSSVVRFFQQPARGFM
jgi:hypothetical protein